MPDQPLTEQLQREYSRIAASVGAEAVSVETVLAEYRARCSQALSSQHSHPNLSVSFPLVCRMTVQALSTGEEIELGTYRFNGSSYLGLDQQFSSELRRAIGGYCAYPIHPEPDAPQSEVESVADTATGQGFNEWISRVWQAFTR